ncbi:unnamed protein product, partial [Meganyctiphanes norvegica]
FPGNECVAVISVMYIILFLPDYSISQPPKPEILPGYDSINAALVESTQSHTSLKNSSYTQSSTSLSTSATDIPQSVLDPSVSASNLQAVSDLQTNISRPYLCQWFSSFTAALRCTFRYRPYGVRAVIIALLVADFFIAIVFAAEFDLLYMFLRDKLGFTFTKYTNYLAFKNLVNGISLMVLLPLMKRLLGDNGLGVLGGLSRIAAFLLLAFVTKTNLVFLVPILDVFGQYLFVALRAVISNLIQENEQG